MPLLSTTTHQTADNLRNRTFLGLIISQFLAGFNDQAIHIAATFYAIHEKVLSEADAIFVMQILFYAPWAIFCTPSAYFADRFSKTASIIAWKFSEILISLLLIAGFVLGTVFSMDIGVWLVIGCVFLMGIHAAFFSPAKYGAMPEILQPHMLSRGNGVLESTTFLSNIMGLVTGGALSGLLKGREYWIGVVLLGLSIIGAIASLMMAKLPASDPKKEFHFFRPLTSGFSSIFGSRPLALSVMGIAFFVFMVSYMRATMLLHGQTHNPPWTEFHTSLIVASVALGVGIGSPLAGILSGGKIELGMVPLGCLGMIGACIVAALYLQIESALVVALLIIGFFSGFYMVPLYAMLQHRSPKKKKGEIVACSNFMNVVGAMSATALFKVLISLAHFTGLAPIVDQIDNAVVGTVVKASSEADHHPFVTIATTDSQKTLTANATTIVKLPPRDLEPGQDVIGSVYSIRNITYWVIRPADAPLKPAFNNEAVPEYLFFGAAGMTTFILLLLWWKLPDFFVRMVYWFRSIGRHQVKAIGMDNLPTNGPVILATNCDRLDASLQMISATDRQTVVVLHDNEPAAVGPLLRSLARIWNVIDVPKGDWKSAEPKAVAALRSGELVGVTLDESADGFLGRLKTQVDSTVVPVWCGTIGPGKIRVVFGEHAQTTDVAELKASIEKLKEWIHANDGLAVASH